MKLFRGIENVPRLVSPAVVAIGNFDGVHQGHQRIIEQIKAIAKQKQLKTCLIFFEPQPFEFFKPNDAPARLSVWTDKLQQFRKHELDQVLMLKFKQTLADMTAERFVESILLPLQTQYLVVGEDFRLGKARTAGVRELEQLAKQYGFQLKLAETLLVAGRRVSSTWIRGLLEQSDFCYAKQLLGQPFQIQGRVVHGDKRGQQLGFPTANLLLKRVNSPLQGVYATQVHVSDGRLLPAVSNVGVRPVFDGSQLMLESHILDFCEQIYGQKIVVRFLKKFRNEEKFSSVEALKNQMDIDLKNAREFHRTVNSIRSV